MATHPLFYDDAYQHEALATVLGVTEGDAVLVSQTIFFPRTSTEPGDLGSIAGCPVVDVERRGTDIYHVLEPGSGRRIDRLSGQQVRLEIDWPRRLLIMRAHSALHLLGSVIEKELGQRAVAGVVREHDGYLVFRSTLAEPEIERSLAIAHQEIDSCIPIRTFWDSEREGFRWCQYGSYPRMPDGGLHVKDASEIGAIELVEQRRRKGKLRVTFRVR